MGKDTPDPAESTHTSLPGTEFDPLEKELVWSSSLHSNTLRIHARGSDDNTNSCYGCPAVPWLVEPSRFFFLAILSRAWLVLAKLFVPLASSYNFPVL
jgi:hypothetical protein